MQGGTVKQFMDALEEMRKVYAFKDEATRLCTSNMRTMCHDMVTIRTVDEKTGVYIEMSKDIPHEEL